MMAKSEWKPRRLDELGFLGRGKSRHRPRNEASLYGGPYPFIQTADVMAADPYITSYSQTYSEFGFQQSKMWPPETLCMTIAGANTARTAILKFEACFPDSMVGFIPDKSKSDIVFVKYALDLMRDRFLSVSRGATQDNLGLEKILSFPILAPDVDGQRRIGAILSAYDELMENSQRRIRLLEAMARALYREWFVHFRFPGHEQHPRVASPLGDIPQGWAATTLGEFVSNGSISLQTGPFGTQLKASQYTDEGTPVINVRNIGFGVLKADKLEFLPSERAEEHKRHKLLEGDIVFGRKGAVERHLLVTPSEQGWIQGSDCIRLRVVSGPLTPRYLSVRFREEDHQRWMMNQCSGGATMASLNQDILCRIPLVVPATEHLAAFDRFCASTLNQMDVLSSQIQNLRRTRDLLLPRLLSGQVELKTEAA